MGHAVYYAELTDKEWEAADDETLSRMADEIDEAWELIKEKHLKEGG